MEEQFLCQGIRGSYERRRGEWKTMESILLRIKTTLLRVCSHPQAAPAFLTAYMSILLALYGSGDWKFLALVFDGYLFVHTILFHILYFKNLVTQEIHAECLLMLDRI